MCFEISKKTGFVHTIFCNCIQSLNDFEVNSVILQKKNRILLLVHYISFISKFNEF